MMNNDTNPSGSTEADRIQAACRQIVARQKEQGGVSPGPSRSNFDHQPAREVVRTELNLSTDNMDALEPKRSAGPRVSTASERLRRHKRQHISMLQPFRRTSPACQMTAPHLHSSRKR